MSTIVRAQPRYLRSSLPNVQPRVLGSFSNTVGAGEQPLYKEAASQTYKVGDLIYNDASLGTFKICTIDTAIAGQAQKPATGTTGAPVMFHAIRPDELFLMNVYHGTPASAVTAQAQLGNNSGLGWALSLTSSVWLVDIENVTNEDGTHANSRVWIEDFYLDYADDTAGNKVKCAIGDTYGLVVVRFMPFSIASDGTPMNRNLQFGW